MRYAIISDIHGNIEALQAVLTHIRRRGIREVVCLGDIVGYGPNPLECIELVKETTQVCVKGNHDEALVEGVVFFNSIAKSSIEWSFQVISQSPDKNNVLQYLGNLPLSFTMEHDHFVHASPLDPTCDYILPHKVPSEANKLQKIFATFESTLFVGHTHLPGVITETLQVLSPQELKHKYQRGEQKAIVNVGSVGQPRDEDPRASYLEVIEDIFFFHRVEYEKDKTKTKILEIPQLDNSLGERILVGK